MIKIPTVIVLGAGASAAYHFPLGKALVQEIASSETRTRLTELGFDAGLAARFQHALLNSGQTSIDSFLAHRREFSEIGKCGIAAALLRREHQPTLFADSSVENWCQLVFNRMRTPRLDDFTSNAVKFVTFNYDRSLEFYLQTAIENTYGVPPERASDVVRGVQIIHVYGSLGPLDRVPYEGEAPPPRVQAAAQSLRVIGEDRSDAMRRVYIREIVSDVRRIYIIGFGFLPENIDWIRPDGVSASGSIYATCYEMEKAEVVDAQNHFGELHVEFLDARALLFLRRAPSL